MNTTGRTIALLGLAGVLVAGCAQPGQLGASAPGSPPDPAAAAPDPAAPAPAAPAPSAAPRPPAPVLLGSGRVEDRVSIRTPGPAVFSVRTEVIAPGESTGWHRHPGTEVSLVKSGSITLLREDGCEATTYVPGSALFVPDAQPHVARNDGDAPAELVVTYLLAPGQPDRADAPAAC